MEDQTSGRYAGQLLTAKEVAKILRVDEESVRRWAREGVIEVVRLPKMKGATRASIRIRGEAIDAILGNKPTQ